MAKNWPIGTLALCAVVAIASFLPWATISLAPGAKGEGGIGDALLALAGEVEGNAWNGSVNLGSLKIPNWVIPVIAVFVAAFVTLRAAGVWSPPRLLCVGLVGFAECLAVWFLVSLALPDQTHDATIGIGLVATLAALAALLGIELRRAFLGAPDRYRGFVAEEAAA